MNIRKQSVGTIPFLEMIVSTSASGNDLTVFKSGKSGQRNVVHIYGKLAIAPLAHVKI